MRLRSRFATRVTVTALLILLQNGSFVSAAEPVDFQKQIKPIFQKYCVSCHGPDEQESGLRIDFGSLLLRGGDRGATIVPGRATESLLYKALLPDGDVSQMPEGQPPLAD